jgi:hypothetical protein
MLGWTDPTWWFTGPPTALLMPALKSQYSSPLLHPHSIPHLTARSLPLTPQPYCRRLSVLARTAGIPPCALLLCVLRSARGVARIPARWYNAAPCTAAATILIGAVAASRPALPAARTVCMSACVGQQHITTTAPVSSLACCAAPGSTTLCGMAEPGQQQPALCCCAVQCSAENDDSVVATCQQCRHHSTTAHQPCPVTASPSAHSCLTTGASLQCQQAT